MAVLGMETSSGDFEVIDLCFAGLPDLYTPSPPVNGKGKGKASEDEVMDVDGESADSGAAS
jgi:DNA polymerase delta subunit 2